MQSVHTLTNGQVLAIDGKTFRGSYNRENQVSTIHMISAYASSNKLVLGQLKTDQMNNEITAIPELLKMLDLRGALVTIDAMACQTRIAKAIVNQGGDYLLTVKNNQGQMRKAIEKAFSHQRATITQDIEFERGHGRVESRQYYVFNSDVLEGNFSRWTGLKNIIMVENF